jgi:putative transposase
VRYAAILAEKARFPVEMMCELLEVSTSGFYAWQKRPESLRTQRDRDLGAMIEAAFVESRFTYGTPRMTAELRDLGEAVAKKRVARLMREKGIAGRKPRRFVVTTDSAHRFFVPINRLQRRFTVGGKERVWAADITYVPTQEGWLYLAVVLELNTRNVVGWATSSEIDSSLVIEALQMALGRSELPQMHHSDRGSQYASDAYQALLAKHRIEASMSRSGDCWDNAVVESFFATLKRECVHRVRFATRREATAQLFDYIECFYNRKRRHSALGFRSPNAYELEVLNPA